VEKGRRHRLTVQADGAVRMAGWEKITGE